ncbi:ABC transporter permease [Streptomyces sp. Act143]|uniref:carbohydrate ABC transporter permease n=1 Tax=Streptomyces sp. Act143 TaxID=2200760 RepID=UPI000D680421|nr:carbohydrate ABC transporter permease [Streptomyces sp. Act143]PWI13011.1 ABC transporter permease [Streptomyces sp. Act143]
MVVSTALRTAKYLGLLFLVLVVLLPVYVLLVTSFKPLSEADPTQAWQLPRHFTTQAWSTAYDALREPLRNSVLLTVPGSLLSAALGSLNGYVLAKWRFPHADLVFTLMLFGMFIPYQAVMIPLVQLWTDLGLSGSVLGLMLAHIVYGIPICTLIFRNYYAAIPTELIEAARVDGAGMLRAYSSVVLPNSGPAFVVVVIWQFTAMWNDFLFAVFLNAGGSQPVTVALNNLAGSQVVPFNQQMAAALLASLPTLVVYVVLGRFFMRGLMAGALRD